MTQPAVIVLEFNELAPRLMDRFIAEGELPNFERLRNESTVAITDPEEPQEKLEPWIQWPTVHTGVSASEHGLEKLGEAQKLHHPTIGRAVSKAGQGVWLCGSMNLPRAAAGRGRYLPDPWNPDAAPAPITMAPFSDFVRANVQEHSNPSARPGVRALGRFGLHIARNGLRPATVSAATQQLVRERRGVTGSWARASVLDRLQWDLFRHHWLRDRPTFATFFSNSTAHYQHVYWRNLEPERFARPPSEQGQQRHGGAVLHGYRSMDGLVANALDLADEHGVTLMLVTALSQQPYAKADASGGKYIYRPHDLSRVLDALGIDGVRQIAPVMAEQFHVRFVDAGAAERAAIVLRQVQVGDRPAFEARVEGDDVFTGCSVHDALDPGARLQLPSGTEVPMDEFFYRSESAKSGFHHPDGIWWIRTGTHRRCAERMSLRSVGPTVLDLLGVATPETMRAPRLTLAA